MSGFHCGRHLPYGLLDANMGFNVDMHKTLRERAEHAIRTTWPEMNGRARAEWLRGLAAEIDAEEDAEDALQREAGQGA